MMEWCPAIGICHTGILTAATGGNLLVGDFRILHDFGHKINPAGMQKTTELMTDMYQKQYRHGFNLCFFNRFHPSLRDLKLPGVVFIGLPNAFWAVLAAHHWIIWKSETWVFFVSYLLKKHPFDIIWPSNSLLHFRCNNSEDWWNMLEPDQPSITPPACRCRHHYLKSMGWVQRREGAKRRKHLTDETGPT